MFWVLYLEFQPSASAHQTLAFQATHLYRRHLQPLKKKKKRIAWTSDWIPVAAMYTSSLVSETVCKNLSLVPIIDLRNRFQVAVCLFSNRSQRTSKCGKNKKWHTRRSRVCHWCPYHILTSSVIYYWTDAWQLGIYLFYIIKNFKKF